MTKFGLSDWSHRFNLGMQIATPASSNESSFRGFRVGNEFLRIYPLKCGCFFNQAYTSRACNCEIYDEVGNTGGATLVLIRLVLQAQSTKLPGQKKSGAIGPSCHQSKSFAAFVQRL